MTLLPKGSVEITDRASHLDAHVGAVGPKRLWICVARRDRRRKGGPGTAGIARSHSRCLRFWHRVPYPAYFAPFRSAASSTSTAASTLRRMPTCCATLIWTSIVVVSPMTAAPGQLTRGGSNASLGSSDAVGARGQQARGVGIESGTDRAWSETRGRPWD